MTPLQDRPRSLVRDPASNVACPAPPPCHERHGSELEPCCTCRHKPRGRLVPAHPVLLFVDLGRARPRLPTCASTISWSPAAPPVSDRLRRHLKFVISPCRPGRRRCLFCISRWLHVSTALRMNTSHQQLFAGSAHQIVGRRPAMANRLAWVACSRPPGRSACLCSFLSTCSRALAPQHMNIPVPWPCSSVCQHRRSGYFKELRAMSCSSSGAEAECSAPHVNHS